MVRQSQSPCKDNEKEICVFCEKRYLSKETLRQHILADHKPKQIQQKQNSFKCQNAGCEKTYEFRRSLKHHMNTIHSHSYSPRRYPCDICGKVLTTSLERHKATQHSGAPNFKCKFCGEEFVDKYKLGGHRRKRHPDKREFRAVEQYPCLFCDKILKTKFSLKKHLTKIHSDIHEEERLMPERPKRSQCKICEASFQNPAQLGLHMKKNHPGQGRNWKRKMEQLNKAKKESSETANEYIANISMRL